MSSVSSNLNSRDLSGYYQYLKANTDASDQYNSETEKASNNNSQDVFHLSEVTNSGNGSAVYYEPKSAYGAKLQDKGQQSWSDIFEETKKHSAHTSVSAWAMGIEGFDPQLSGNISSLNINPIFVRQRSMEVTENLDGMINEKLQSLGISLGKDETLDFTVNRKGEVKINGKGIKDASRLDAIEKAFNDDRSLVNELKLSHALRTYNSTTGKNAGTNDMLFEILMDREFGMSFFCTFRDDDCIDELTSAQIAEWKTMLRKKLKESTVAGSITKVRVVFNWAVEQGWLEKSPMVGVARGSFTNPENDQYISREDYLKLLDACPCQEWRTVLALARYGGVRCPSEVMLIRWGDIDWAGNRFLVHSPKTEKHVGKASRFVPLFPEVREELNTLYFMPQSEGKEFVINRFPKREKSNLGTQFKRIVQLAGLEPIKRPYDNMRASRSNEIYAQFGPYYETQWIGHTSKIARDHYLQIRDEDFSRAAEWTDQTKVQKGAAPEKPTEKKDLSVSRYPGEWNRENPD